MGTRRQFLVRTATATTALLVQRRSTAAERKAIPPPAWFWHWGDNGNWKNFVLIQPRDKSALVVFTNGSHGMNVAERLVAAATGDDHVAFQWL